VLGGTLTFFGSLGRENIDTIGSLEEHSQHTLYISYLLYI
jgi:hypothetical protein